MFLLLVVTLSHLQCKAAGYPPHSHLSPSLPLPCVAVCHQVPNALYNCAHYLRRPILVISSLCGNNLVYGHMTSRTFQTYDNNLGSLTVPVSEARHIVKLILLLLENRANICCLQQFSLQKSVVRKKKPVTLGNIRSFGSVPRDSTGTCRNVDCYGWSNPHTSHDPHFCTSLFWFLSLKLNNETSTESYGPNLLIFSDDSIVIISLFFVFIQNVILQIWVL